MKIKEYRILKGYTQSEIANILNIKQSSYSNIISHIEIFVICNHSLFYDKKDYISIALLNTL